MRRRVGFLPWAVERAINDLIKFCSAPGPTDHGLEKEMQRGKGVGWGGGGINSRGGEGEGGGECILSSSSSQSCMSSAEGNAYYDK